MDLDAWIRDPDLIVRLWGLIIGNCGWDFLRAGICGPGGLDAWGWIARFGDGCGKAGASWAPLAGLGECPGA